VLASTLSEAPVAVQCSVYFRMAPPIHVWASPAALLNPWPKTSLFHVKHTGDIALQKRFRPDHPKSSAVATFAYRNALIADQLLAQQGVQWLIPRQRPRTTYSSIVVVITENDQSYGCSPRSKQERQSTCDIVSSEH
jgi:hypothetical protein